MKNLSLAVAFTFVATAVFAQPGHSNQISAYLSDRNRVGKSEVKIAAIRNFVKHFGDVENALWSRKIDGFRVDFNKNKIKFMVDYDNKGKWVSTIRVYDEADLRSDLRKVVRSNYIDYKIVKVIEVTIGNSHVHFVKTESQTSLLTLHIMNGEITEMQKYRKG